ncbi:MAG: 50S ribosomal protein L29 [Candidatus Binatia bacterium]
MKIGELRELGQDELRAKERELGDEIRHLRMRRATAQLASPAKLRSTRRDLARVKTLLRERQGTGNR